jgi:hypothetical protein
MHRSETSQQQHLAEVLERVLDHGVVLEGELVISVAEVELIYISLKAVVSSVESLERKGQWRSAVQAEPRQE